MSQLHFYATRADLLDVLDTLEARTRVKYARAGSSKSATPDVYARAADIPNLGRTDADSWTRATSYLVIPQDEKVWTDQSVFDGEVRFNVFTGINPTGIEISPSGILEEGFLIYGRVASLDMTETARMLQRKSAALIKKRFTRVGYAWVGPEAYALLQAGWRLSQAVQNPPEYALPRPA